MRITSNGSEIKTNVEDTSVDFSIGDPAVIIEILRNKLYSDKIKVVVQEYLSNARDGMREVKNSKDKIKVTLPTNQRPTFKIRDFGPGLSPERVRDVFVQFGRSTKRDDDGQTGGFGIGAKSAYAYTDAFQIISYYNGTETHYVAHLGKKATGSLQIMHQGETTEPNGVEIQIGVNKTSGDILRFQESYFKTVAYWGDESPVLTNPTTDYIENLTYSNDYKEYQKAQQKPLYKTDSLNLINRALGEPKRHSYSSSRICVRVDGIIYEVPKATELDEIVKPLLEMVDYSTVDIHLVAGNGDVEVSASREALQIGDKTKAGLKKIVDEAVNGLNQFVTDSINGCQSFTQVQKVAEIFSLLIQPKARYYRKTINGITFNFEKLIIDNLCYGLYRHPYGRNYKLESVSANILASHIVYLDSNLDVAKVKAKLSKWDDLCAYKRAEVIVVNYGNPEQAKFLGATNISSISSISKKKSSAPKRQLEENEFPVKIFDHDLKLRNETVKAGTNNKYIVVNPNSDAVSNTEFAPLQALLENQSIKICFASEKIASKMICHANFIIWSEFLKNPEGVMGKENFNKAVTFLKTKRVPSESRYFKVLNKKTPNILDQKVVTAVTQYCEFYDKLRYSGSYLSSSAFDPIVNRVFPEIDIWGKEADDMISYLKEEYPLLWGSLSCESKLDEMVLYMNLKHQYKKASDS